MTLLAKPSATSSRSCGPQLELVTCSAQSHHVYHHIYIYIERESWIDRYIYIYIERVREIEREREERKQYKTRERYIEKRYSKHNEKRGRRDRGRERERETGRLISFNLQDHLRVSSSLCLGLAFMTVSVDLIDLESGLDDNGDLQKPKSRQAQDCIKIGLQILS